MYNKVSINIKVVIANWIMESVFTLNITESHL